MNAMPKCPRCWTRMERIEIYDLDYMNCPECGYKYPAKVNSLIAYGYKGKEVDWSRLFVYRPSYDLWGVGK